MLTAILLTPVVAVLVWLYWYLLPVQAGRRWRWMDSALLAVLTALAAGFVDMAMNAHYEGAGPMWPELVSTVGAYGIYLIGLAAGLLWRRLS